MTKHASSSRPVYSTDSGRLCPDCGQPIAQCACSKTRPRAAGDGVVRVSRESKGRGGKQVTLVKGLALDDAALQALGKKLKSACGSGGTVKEGVIEIQGEHGERLLELLAKEGWKAKRAGG